jgi:beta-lactamase class D
MHDISRASQDNLYGRGRRQEPATILQQGDCAGRVTPASTFKVALSVIGYDTGFLKDEHNPTLPFRKGYVDWGGDNWKQPTDAVRWLKYSVVWFSQQITHALGEETLHDYATKLSYGNADFSGDVRKEQWPRSGLDRVVSEDIAAGTGAFLRKLVNRRAARQRSRHGYDDEGRRDHRAARRLVRQGKTGMAYPRKPDYTFDEQHPWGWFVGWARKDDRTLVFARLIQDDRKTRRHRRRPRP